MRRKGAAASHGYREGSAVSFGLFSLVLGALHSPFRSQALVSGPLLQGTRMGRLRPGRWVVCIVQMTRLREPALEVSLVAFAATAKSTTTHLPPTFRIKRICLRRTI